jgi:protein gp37
MGGQTGISWTTSTFNPWVGCHKRSQGCAHCYMFREQIWRGQDPNIVRRTKTWRDPFKWEKIAAASRKPYYVFTCSYSDFFIEEADPWREEVWDIIRQTPHLTYQLLTKRPERLLECLPKTGNIPRNIWWGVTVENQENVERLTILENALYGKAIYETDGNPDPYPLIWVSVEPMLSALDLSEHLGCITCRRSKTGNVIHSNHPYPYGLSWIVAGCESGPGARPMELDWVRNLRDQCVDSDTPFFLKQMLFDGQTPKVLVKTPILDGRTWTEFPEV